MWLNLQIALEVSTAMARTPTLKELALNKVVSVDVDRTLEPLDVSDSLSIQHHIPWLPWHDGRHLTYRTTLGSQA